MMNMEKGLNNVKSRIWSSFRNVTNDTYWEALVSNPITTNTRKALDLLRAVSYPQVNLLWKGLKAKTTFHMQGLCVFNYINANNVQKLMGEIHSGLIADARQFDIFFAWYVNNLPPTNLRGLWGCFINFYARRIANSHRNYIYSRIARLLAPWTAQAQQTLTPQNQRSRALALQGKWFARSKPS